MSLLSSGCDTSVIALLLGHEQVITTDRIYIHSDMSIKQRALDRTRPLNVKPGRYRPPDPLLAFLSNLSAPRGALTYPLLSREGLEVISLGPMAYPDSKEKGDRSMPWRSGSRAQAYGARSRRDPRDMAKA